MPTISACVIAKNEQDCISRCLQSIQAIVDEIILVDTGSSDNTVELAEGFGARIFHYAWNDDFAAARNYALDQASSQWIIFLDADEYIDADKAGNIRPLLNKLHGNRKIHAITCVMRHTSGWDGPYMGLTQAVRIYRNSPQIRYCGRIHESICKGMLPVQGMSVGENILTVHHTGYTETALTEKSLRNLAYLEKDLADHTTNQYTYYYLSQSYLNLGEHEKAIHFARQALADDRIASTFIAYKPYVYMLKSLKLLGSSKQTELAQTLAEALQKFPHHPEILYFAGLQHFAAGHFARALAYFLQTLQADRTFADMLDNEFTQVADVHCLVAGLYEMKNAPQQAFDHWILALKRNKHHQLAFDRLINLVRRQDPVETVRLLNQLYNPQQKDDAVFVVRRLAKLNLTRVFAHYVKLLSAHFPSATLIALKLFVCQKHAQAFQAFAADYQQNGGESQEMMAVLSVLLAERPAWLEELYPQTHSSLKKISVAFLGQLPAGGLTEADFPSYSQLLQTFCYHADDCQLSRLLDLIFLFPNAHTSLQVIDLLIDRQLFQPAFTLSLHALGRPDCPSVKSGEFSFKAALCCYRIKNFARAVDYFSQSLLNGFSGNGIDDFLAWTHEQCKDSLLQEKIEILRRQHQLNLLEAI